VGSRVRRESIGCVILLEDVAPIEQMSHSGACGQTSAVARFWTDLDRGSIFLALCEVIGDPRVKRNSRAMQKGKAITHQAVQAELELEIENLLLMLNESALGSSIPPS
jgi:hypothetical protein